MPLTNVNGEWGWMNFYRPIDGPPLLLNMNYLTSSFRTELADATERALQPFMDRVSATHIPFIATAGKIAG